MKIRQERGQATAEYSVGTIGAVFIAFWLWRIGAGLGPDNPIGKLVRSVFERVVDLGRVMGGPDWAWRWFM